MIFSKKYKGAELLQKELPSAHFDNSDQGNVTYNPPTDDTGLQLSGYFYNTHHPRESGNVSWHSVKVNWTKSSTSTPEFETKIQLYGLDMGYNQELVGEYQTSTITGSDVTEDYTFELHNSGGLQPFTRFDETAPAGKYKVHLPLTYKNYETINLTRCWYDPDWTKANYRPVTYSGTGLTKTVGPLTVSYDADMDPSFSDIVFTDRDGETVLKFWQETHTDNTIAYYYVGIFDEEPSGLTKNVYYYYGTPGAASIQTTPQALFNYYDDWEDNKYTGRSSPYQNWTVSGGTAAINSATPIYGTYSIKHTGTGDYSTTNGMWIVNTLTSYNARFKFQITTTGTTPYTPWFRIFTPRYIDSTHYLTVDSYYNSGTGKQVVRVLEENGAGTVEICTPVNWLTGTPLTSSVYEAWVVDTGSNIKLYIDTTPYIDKAYSSNVTTGKKGFGSMGDTATTWDNLKIWATNTITVGAPGTEISTVTVTPDSADDDDTYVTYTTPSDWGNYAPLRLSLNEYGNTTYESPYLNLSPQATAKLGYDGVDKYVALRTRYEVKGSDAQSVTFNSAEYVYEA
jgi:hypothetical protein